MIRVLLADKQRLLHPGIRATLSTVDDITLVAELSDCARLQKLCQNDPPDIILLAPNIAGSSYLVTLNTLRQRVAPQYNVESCVRAALS